MVESEKITELTQGQFDEFIKEGIVVIDFFAEWCMPCLMMSPILDGLAEELKGRVKFGKVDISENQELAKKYSVSSIPNFLVLKDGKVAGQFMGALSEEDFKKKIESFE